MGEVRSAHWDEAEVGDFLVLDLAGGYMDVSVVIATELLFLILSNSSYKCYILK